MELLSVALLHTPLPEANYLEMLRESTLRSTLASDFLARNRAKSVKTCFFTRNASKPSSSELF